MVPTYSSLTGGPSVIHFLKNIVYFPLLVFKGIDFTTGYCFLFFQGAKKQMEGVHPRFGWEGSPTKVCSTKKKVGTLILASLLEERWFPAGSWSLAFGSEACPISGGAACAAASHRGMRRQAEPMVQGVCSKQSHLGSPFPAVFVWVWVPIKPPGDRRFKSLVPFTRATQSR